MPPPADTLAVPAPRPLGGRPRARSLRGALKHPLLTPYHRLLAGVLLVNLALLWVHLERGDWRIDDGSALSALAGLTLVNLAAAVLIRQQTVLNTLFGLAGRAPRAWPLAVRWGVSKVHHVGGLHAGAALAGTGWLGAFAVVTTVTDVRHPAAVSSATLVLSYCLVALALLVVVCAAPAVRARAHEAFEWSHRFGGWSAIGAVLGAEPRDGRADVARRRARGPHGERGVAVGAPAARADHGRAPVVARGHRAPRLRRHPRVRLGRSRSAAARCASGTRSPP